MARSTASRASGLTFGDPLTTRETVPRPTPARAATASRVGRACVRSRTGSFCRWQADPASLDHGGVPPGAALGDARLRPVVDVHEAEPLGVAPAPLEVVHQRPGEIPT